MYKKNFALNLDYSHINMSDLVFTRDVFLASSDLKKKGWYTIEKYILSDQSEQNLLLPKGCTVKPVFFPEEKLKQCTVAMVFVCDSHYSGKQFLLSPNGELGKMVPKPK
jgi:hypothetical protein